MHTLLALATPRPERDLTNAVLGAAPWSGWKRVPGVTPGPSGLAVTGINRRVWPEPSQTHDSSETPGVNNEVALAFTGDFQITLKARLNTGSDLYLRLWGYVPMVQDEWRPLNNMISLECQRWGEWGGNNGTVYWSAYDMYWVNEYGSGDVQMGLEGDEIEFVVRREGSVITVTGNGDPIMTYTDAYDMFPNGEVYFGMHEDRVGETSYITEITAQAVGAGSTVRRKATGARYVPKSNTSLRHYARENYPGFRIGTCVAAHPLGLDPTYGNVLGREFNEITAEHCMKMNFVQPQQGVYDFSEADLLVEFAVANNMAIHGHCLVWDAALPGWLTEGVWSPAQLETIMVGHITAVVGRYAGVIRSWDVINEPFEGFTADLRNNIWHQAMGPEYISIALHAANLADPAAKLFINEWGVEDPGTKSQALQALFSQLLSDDVPVHGVGFQMHEDVNAEYQETWPDDTPSADKLTFSNAADTYTNLGLLFRVSEMDVNRHQVLPTTEVAMEHYYWDILDVCIEKGAYSFCMWGFTDRWSSLQGWWDYHAYGNGMIFDADYQPKLAYDGLSYRLRDLPSPSPRPDPEPPEEDMPPIHWTAQSIDLDYRWAFGVAHGNGTWVVLGDNGALLTSSDGVNWTVRPDLEWDGYPEDVNDVAYADGQFVAVGRSGLVSTSPDGINWTDRNGGLGTSELTCVARGAGLWVAGGGYSGVATTSPDGITWTPLGAVMASNMIRLAYANGLWVAAGGWEGGTTTSTNGTTWTQRTIPDAEGGLSGIAYGNGTWVAVGGDDIWGGPNGAAAYTSPDGINWTKHKMPTPAPDALDSVAFGQGHFVAGAFEDGSLYTSPDGINWTLRFREEALAFIHVAYANDRWVAVGVNKETDEVAIATSVPSLT